MKNIKSLNSFTKENMEEEKNIKIIDYIADATLEDLFSHTINSVVYGVHTRKKIGNNDGIFDVSYIEGIIENTMDDNDIFNELGTTGFNYIYKHLKDVCKNYLKLIDNNELNQGEVSFIRDNYKNVYDNTINSLKKIIEEN